MYCIKIITRIKQNHPNKSSPKPVFVFFVGEFPKTLREIPNHLSRTGGDSAARSGSSGIVDVEFGEVLGRGSRCMYIYLLYNIYIYYIFLHNIHSHIYIYTYI